MIKLIGLITSILLVHTLAAQDRKETFYVFDKNWKAIELKDAVYFLRVREIGEKQFLWTTYNIYGPRISQELFQDATGNIRNGSCTYYRPNGNRDSSGSCVNNLPDGSWWYYNDQGLAIMKKYYNNGVLVKDSLITPPPENLVYKLDSGEVESTFKGGPKGWLRFMNSNFKYPERAQNSNVQGSVWLEFVVDEKGNIQHPEINRSVEYSIDEEALRLISLSPAWTPASRNGKIVKSYKRQPITFKLTPE